MAVVDGRLDFFYFTGLCDLFIPGQVDLLRDLVMVLCWDLVDLKRVCQSGSQCKREESHRLFCVEFLILI